MVQKTSIFDVVVLIPSAHPMFAYHPLSAPDRLGNPEIDFPLGVVFADRDYFGSDGADEIVKNNKYFQTGQSQLFRLDDSSHEIPWDQPDKLVEMMIGFFEGTIKGKFELKPRDYFPIASN